MTRDVSVCRTPIHRSEVIVFHVRTNIQGGDQETLCRIMAFRTAMTSPNVGNDIGGSVGEVSQ